MKIFKSLQQSIRIFYKQIWLYKVYRNLSYLWNFGFLSMICFIIQLITGLFLSMYYIADIESAFISVEHIMRDVNAGWLIRYCHLTGASFFFICVYIHIFRNLYFNTYIYPRHWVWVCGMIIFIIMILTAFLGYVLPWGQMSFWAATVITSIFSAIPFIGNEIVIWIWGGYGVDYATLTRFYTLHFLCPFILLLLIGIHIILLHIWGSSNPIGLIFHYDKLPFGPYFVIKDFFSLGFFFIIYFWLLFFYPNYLNHTDNYIEANPLVTPAHIVPEWYFLPFYAVLRSIPNKLGGVIMLGIVLILLIILPFWIMKTTFRTFVGNFLYEISFWSFLIICLLLGWIGGKPMEVPYIELGQYFTIIYVCYLSITLYLIKKLSIISQIFSRKIIIQYIRSL